MRSKQLGDLFYFYYEEKLPVAEIAGLLDLSRETIMDLLVGETPEILLLRYHYNKCENPECTFRKKYG
jgi:predicted DNA-binding protein YlxM (UPF0122 family)